MSRWAYEGVFYRVFCASLLIIAFTFTVILTNVFIDIDGLLSRKEQENPGRQVDHRTPNNFIEKHEFKVNNERQREREHIEFKNYDTEGVYRTKRSLDSTDFLLHIKNPKIKNVLANRLATLLEELEDDESKSDIVDKNDKPKINIDDVYVKNENRVKNEDTKKPEVAVKKDDIDLHTAMHNLLREGIVGHMDLNSVYTKVHELVKMYKSTDSKKKENTESARRSNKEKLLQVTSPTINEENQFFEELVTCKTLQQEVVDLTKEEKKEDITKVKVKTPKFLIKTFIDIQKNEKDASSKEVRGVIRLVYNGKSIKIKSMDEFEATTLAKPKVETTTEHVNTPDADAEELSDLIKLNVEKEQLSKTHLDHLLAEYLTKFKKTHDIPEAPVKYVEKRLKRNIKIDDENQTDKQKKNDKAEDDELFVEIETHYDSKGMKGKKKEELIKQLIEKIQKAIRSNQDENKHLKHLHEIKVKKRIQNPLDHKNGTRHIMLKDILLPYGTSSFYRELYPITKIGTDLDPLPIVNNGYNWMKQETGPKLLSTSKSINSAELSQLDVDFKKVVEFSGVPQRLQIPLNTDLSGESQNAYFDLGKLQFLVKDLEGSGFSIGVNQYIDHAPDPESTKLFTGIEKLISKYQQNYDRNYLSMNRADDAPKHEMEKRDLNTNLVKKNDVEYKHKINRRSIFKGQNFHSNEYFLYKDNIPYNNYQEIYEDREKKVSFSINDHKYQDMNKKDISIKKMPNDLQNILEKKLKPSEIFKLATLLDRKKRSVRRFKNLKKKIHVNRFINTNAKAAQTIILKSKRNKRQVGKIRIIAKDSKGNSESDENIYIVSGEHLYADRAILRHVNVPNSVGGYKAEEQVDEPIIIENTKRPIYNVFEESVRHSPYMMKYPHIFLDDTDDKFSIETPTRFGKIAEHEMVMTTENDLIDKMDTIPSVHDLVNALKPYPKAKYKVTVKILPKDSNITNGGFREVHTSINKTYNKNGMMYSSQVNVSEISKIETANTTIVNNHDDKKYTILATTPNILQNKHDELKRQIKEHKERIDKQLDNLNKEKDKLTSIMLNNTYEVTTKKNNLMDILLNLKDTKTLHLNKDDISKVFCDAVKQQEKITTTTIKSETTTIKSVMDPLKVKLLKAISQNEQLTSQILNKIDQNSIMLQSFLSKISDKIQTLPDITRQAIIEHEKKTQTPREPMHLNYGDPHFYMKLANRSDFGVPIIYYPQPNILRNKLEMPPANLVYSGYRNQATNHNMINPKTNPDDLKLEIRNNSSRYFVDDDFFRTYPSTVIKHENKAEDAKVDVKVVPDVYSLNIPKPIVEKKGTIIQPYKFKSNAPLNATKF